MKIYAILLAAGTGSRTGASIPKQLVKIKDKEILLRSLEIFTKSKIDFDGIIVAVPPPSVFNFDWSGFFGKNIEDAEMKKLAVITGGAERRHSTANAVKYLENILPSYEAENAVVFIHDSARPFVKDEELRILLDETVKSGAAFLCAAVTETIKEIDSGGGAEAGRNGRKHNAVNKNVKETPIEISAGTAAPLKLKTLKREKLISAKTPQVFKFKILESAVEKAAESNFISTDDVSLVENIGIPVVPILSTGFNIKITTALDIEIAELFCERFDDPDPAAY